MPISLKRVNQLKANRAARGSSALNLSRSLLVAVSLAVLLALASMPPGRSQSSGSNGGSNGVQNGGNGAQSTSSSGYPGHGGFTRIPGDDDYDPMMSQRRIRALNTVRQKLLVQDTNKLFRLAKELNQEVAASNPSAWTPDQLHKIAEIEKLAHGVRERMASGVGEPVPGIADPGVIYAH